MQISTKFGRLRGRMWVAVLGLTVAATLAACAETGAPTTTPLPALTGISVDATDHSVALRDLFIPDPGAAGYPAGASVPLAVQVWNNTNAPVSLTAAAVTGGVPASLIDAKTTATAPVTVFDLPIGADASISLTQQSGRFLQLQCSGTLRAGTGVPMTFTFSNGATIVVNVPIGQSIAVSAGPTTSGTPVATCR